MARLVSIDYNPLRRSTSTQGSAEMAAFKAQRIGLSGESLNLSQQRLQLEEDKVSYQQEKQEGGVFKYIEGGIKILGAVGLGIVTGGAALPAAIGLGLSGVGDITEQAFGVGGEYQTSISLAGSLGQQIWDVRSRDNNEAVNNTINKAIAADQAAGQGGWSVNVEGALDYTPGPATTTAVAEMNEKYGGLMMSKNPGTEMLDGYVNKNVFNGAQQVYQQLLQQQSQTITNSLEQFKSDGDFNNVLGTIDSLNMPDNKRQAAITQAAQVAQYYRTDAKARELVETEGVEAAYNYIEGGGDRTIPAAVGKGKEQSRYTGGSGKSFDESVEERAAEISRGDSGMSPEEATKRARKEITEEGTSGDIYLDEREKGALMEAAARHNTRFANMKGAEAAARFTNVYENMDDVTTALAAKKETMGDSKNTQAKAAVEKAVTQLQVQALGDRFITDFLSADTLGELEAMEKRYNPEGGSYTSAYEGQTPLQWTHYDKIRNEIDGRKKMLEDAWHKEEAQENKKVGAAQRQYDQERQDTAYAMVAAWKSGSYTNGQTVLQVLSDAVDLIPPDKYLNLYSDVLFGVDGNPETKEAFKNATDMYKSIGIDDKRQGEMAAALYQMRTDGATPEAINEQIEIFRKTESGGFITKAMETVGHGQGLSPGRLKDIIAAGARGDLDQYFIQRSTRDSMYKAGGPEKEYVTVGGQPMEGVMATVREGAAKEMKRLLGKDVEVRMMYDEAGDNKGFPVTEVDGKTLRLSVGSGWGKPYGLQALEGGEWVEYKPQKVVQPRGTPGANIANRGKK
jgi:hypothetical protein